MMGRNKGKQLKFDDWTNTLLFSIIPSYVTKPIQLPGRQPSE